jgi:hypothetical protein
MAAISAWLEKLADLVNLGKLLTDGGPGTVLAIALVFALSTYRGVPLIPTTYSGESDRPTKERAGELGRLDKDIDSLRAALAGCTSEKATADAELAVLQASLQKNQESIDNLTKVQYQRTATDSLPVPALDHALEKLRAGRMEQCNSATITACPAQAELEGRSAELAKLAENTQAKLVRAEDRRKALEGKTVDTLAELLSGVLSHLVGLALIGYVLGTMLSPINRLFLTVGDDPEASAESAQPSQGSNAPADPPQNGKRAPRERPAAKRAWPKRAVVIVRGQPTSYWVGNGAISSTEVNGYVTGYYRWAEVSVNMIIPTACLFLAFSYWLLWVHRAYSWSVGGVGALTAGAVYWLGKVGRRHHDNYRRQLFNFIEGRLAHIDEQAKAAKQATDAQNALATQV